MDVKDETKNETQGTQKKPEGKLELVKNSRSIGTREVMRAASGRFTARRKKLDEELKITERVESDIRTLLTRPATDDQGQPIKDANGKPVPLHIKVAEHLLSVAMKLDDPKALGGAAKMLESIMTRGLGKPSDSAVTRDSLQHAGVRVVIIANPSGLPQEEEKPREALKPPEWIQAETVTINEPKNLDVIEKSEK